jgi:two-component system, NarL family, nitrate/nitrite response regulator NarL
MIRAAVYTDSPILAHGFQTVAAADPELSILGVHGSLEELIDSPSLYADVFVVDLTPDVTFAALSKLKKAAGGVKIILWANAISSELAFQALGLGIRGVMRKTLPPEMLLKCIRKVHEGELWFEKALTDSFLSANRIALTRREGQLVTLLSQGKKNKEIAGLLMITEGTVKVYLSKLYDKLGVKDRFELALYGLKNLGTASNAGQAEQTGSLAAGTVAPLRSLVIERR